MEIIDDRALQYCFYLCCHLRQEAPIIYCFRMQGPAVILVFTPSSSHKIVAAQVSHIETPSVYNRESSVVTLYIQLNGYTRFE
jgi:hypothetical protein